MLLALAAPAPLQGLREDELRSHFAADIIFKREHHIRLYSVRGRPVCFRAYLLLFAVSKHKWENIMSQANLGGSLPCSKPYFRASPMADFVEAFLESFFQIWTMPSPDYSHVRVLAHFFSMEMIAEFAEQWNACPLSDRPPHPPSVSSLRCVWRCKFPHVVEPHMSEFGSCGRCRDLLARLRAAKGKDTEHIILQEIKAHQAAVAAQRAYSTTQILAA